MYSPPFHQETEPVAVQPTGNMSSRTRYSGCRGDFHFCRGQVGVRRRSVVNGEELNDAKTHAFFEQVFLIELMHGKVRVQLFASAWLDASKPI